MIVRSKKVIRNPSQEEMRLFAAEMPQAVLTNCNNYNVNTRVTARSPESTVFVSDEEMGQERITYKEYKRIEKIQDEYISENEMVLIEGAIGPDAGNQVKCNLLIEKKNANIGAMQQQLYFPSKGTPHQELMVIDTPNLYISGYPSNRIITVDLANYTTRIIGSDYFGESKKGGLRMWNEIIFEDGGLALHAGCKIYPDILGQEKLILIIGLSGTGKTTTTFRTQLKSLPVQDDFCALYPGGHVQASENGCFAKTFGLTRENEPVIHDALTSSSAWLENVSVSPDGTIDFQDGSRTTNGRGTFGFENIEHRSPSNLPNVSSIILLNRNFNIIPAVTKLKPEQAAAYFMLGETTGTSAGGDAEAGKFLRIPGTNPFFCRDHALQGNRFLDILNTCKQIDVYLLNTGRVGGGKDRDNSKKVTINDSSLILEGIIKQDIRWTEDEDFGYLVADEVAGIDGDDILKPKKLYRKQNRENDYMRIAQFMQNDREEYIRKIENLYSQIKNAIHHSSF